MGKFVSELQIVKELYKNGIFSPDFYKSRIKDESVFDSYEAFQTIPFMYKKELRSTSAMERTTTPKSDIYGVFSSSGTTGEKTFYVYSKKDKLVHEEFVRTFYTELGVCPEDIGGVMAPVDTGVMAHTMMWQFTTMGAGYVNCPIPSPENMIDTVYKVPVTIIATRPSTATGVAYNPFLVEKANKSSVRKLFLGGGFLSGERRKLLENAWGADCYNMFGMSEMFGPMAGECRQQDGLHYLDKYLMIEIVNPSTGEPVKDGEAGVAVYTTLWNKGFPLLRYWTDDMMIIKHEKCPCGSDNPRLYYLGRINDSFMINGKYIFPESVENILFAHGYIGEYRVEKEKEGFLVKVEALNTEVKQCVLEELEELFEGPVKVEIVSPGGLNYDGHGKRFIEE